MDNNLFQVYLAQQKKLLSHAKSDSSGISRLTLVIGNESCDLDSIIGSVTLAFCNFIYENKIKTPYHLQQILQSQQNSQPIHYFLPIINCHSEDISSRFEFMYLNQTFNFGKENLIYFFDDDFGIQNYLDTQANHCKCNIILYDHNYPSCNQSFLSKFVVEIFDHHQDTTYQYGAESQKTIAKHIELVGSACTLVAQHIKSLELNNAEIMQPVLTTNVGFSLLCAILLDTQNFQPNLKLTRWVDSDLDSMNYLTKVIEKNADLAKYVQKFIQHGKIDLDQVYNSLIEMKFDSNMNLNLLSLHQLLTKDQKDFQYPIQNLQKKLSQSVFKIKYSVFYMGPQQLMQKHTCLKIIEYSIALMAKESLDAIMLMFVFNKPESKQIEREFILMCKDAEFVQNMVDSFKKANLLVRIINLEEYSAFDDLQSMKAYLLLQSVQFIGFQDLTSTYTRKIIEPIIAGMFK